MSKRVDGSKIARNELKMSKELIFCIIKSELFTEYMKMVTYRESSHKVLEVLEKLSNGNYDRMIEAALPGVITFYNTLEAVHVFKNDLLDYGKIVSEIKIPQSVEYDEDDNHVEYDEDDNHNDKALIDTLRLILQIGIV
ncbi:MULTISPECIES: hypothetical protein [Priestia]|uniref:hypothetical protein n=1 Tax=Priestia TaxID=2800373 RepID=UPI001C8DAD7E|nr:hypothetical protein [Priestia aryabhattai]MBY0210628.1 hypothetical protein [Priestia aryabhattai]